MRSKYFLPLVLLALSLPARSQNVRDLIISEVLAEPDSSGIVDDYGRRTGWIELFNTSQGTVPFGGCFLTDDRGDLRKSLIPKGDLRTKLGPRQTALFYASGNGSEGTFYAGFTLAPGKTVYLVSNDGRTVIDSLRIPADLPAGLSVSKEAHDLRQMAFTPNDRPGKPTPGIANGRQDATSKSQFMAEKDPHGVILALAAIAVVFSTLAILWGLFILLFRIIGDKKGKKTVPTPEEAAAIALALDMEENGEVYAAIAAAVDRYLSDTDHDAETYVVTIRPRTSEWNDKKQNFRKLPR